MLFFRNEEEASVSRGTPTHKMSPASALKMSKLQIYGITSFWLNETTVITVHWITNGRTWHRVVSGFTVKNAFRGCLYINL